MPGMPESSRKVLLISRHGEREDRYQESQGNDWISQAHSDPTFRPQDPCLSDNGKKQVQAQALRMGSFLRQRELRLRSVYSSPTVRCVQTAHLYINGVRKDADADADADAEADEGADKGTTSILLESGLLEEARCFRGREDGEPRPCWSPALVLDATNLQKWSPLVDVDEQAQSHMVSVRHVPCADNANGVLEVHQHDSAIVADAAIIDARVRVLEHGLRAALQVRVSSCLFVSLRVSFAITLTLSLTPFPLSPSLLLVGSPR